MTKDCTQSITINLLFGKFVFTCVCTPCPLASRWPLLAVIMRGH